MIKKTVINYDVDDLYKQRTLNHLFTEQDNITITND